MVDGSGVFRNAMLDVIVINRQCDLDRLAFMTSQLDSLGIRFYRLDAFTPDTMPDDLPKGYWRRGARPMSPRERACFLSHQAAWEWIARTGPALVLEDDVILARQVRDILSDLAATDELEHLALEVRATRKTLAHKSIPIAHGVAAHRLYFDTTGSAAYILWPSGARKLMADAARAPAATDALICHSTALRSYQANPALAMQLALAGHFGLDLDDLPQDTPLKPPFLMGTPWQWMRRAGSTWRLFRRRLRHLAGTKTIQVPVKIEFFDN